MIEVALTDFKETALGQIAKLHVNANNSFINNGILYKRFNYIFNFTNKKKKLETTCDSSRSISIEYQVQINDIIPKKSMKSFKEYGERRNGEFRLKEKKTLPHGPRGRLLDR